MAKKDATSCHIQRNGEGALDPSSNRCLEQRLQYLITSSITSDFEPIPSCQGESIYQLSGAQGVRAFAKAPSALPQSRQFFNKLRVSIASSNIKYLNLGNCQYFFHFQNVSNFELKKNISPCVFVATFLVELLQCFLCFPVVAPEMQHGRRQQIGAREQLGQLRQGAVLLASHVWAQLLSCLNIGCCVLIGFDLVECFF